MIRFTCPKCSKHLKAPAAYAGKRVTCVSCGYSVVTPAAASHTWRMAPRLVIAISAAIFCLASVFVVIAVATPSHIDQTLATLKTDDRAASTSALEWLAEQPPQDAQRAKVTSALESLIMDGGMHNNLDSDIVLRTYLAWADKDNVPAMVRMVQTPTMPNWSNQKTGLVMAALGKLGDERAYGALAEKLADPVLHDQALNALRVAGPKAKLAVAPLAFDANPQTRALAQRLLDEFGASPRLLADQAFALLASPQEDAKRTALDWFINHRPANDTQKAAGARLLGKMLSDPSPAINGTALRALKTWATTDALPDLAEYARRDQKSLAGNTELLDVLSQFPDANAAQAIALQLPNGNTRAQASQALLKLGDVAGNAVLQYINSPDAAVRDEARSLAQMLNASNDRQLDQTLRDVADMQIDRSLTALRHLAQMRPDDANRDKVSVALNATLLDPTRGLSNESLNALIVWKTPANVDTLLKMLGTYDRSNVGRNNRVIEFLGALKDSRAAVALAPGLEHGGERGAISTALKSIGADAQSAVFPYLDSLNEATRIEASRILGEIGTTQSLDPLQQAYLRAGGDPVFSQELQVAMQRIMART